MHESDEAVYRRFLETGNEDNLRILFDRHRESLILFLTGFVHSREDAEELMIDAFAVAASGTAAYSGRSSFKTWLFAIASNQACSFIRKQRRSTGKPELPGDAETPELSVLKQEKNRQLYEALTTLKDDYRHVLHLLYFEQMNMDEACVVMNKNKKQLYHLAERGRSALRETLKRMGYDDEQLVLMSSSGRY